MLDKRCCVQLRTGTRRCPYASVGARKIVSLNANWYEVTAM